MLGKIVLFPLFIACASAAASYLLPDSVVLRHCIGPGCPTVSLPILLEGEDAVDGSNQTVDCSSGKDRVLPDPSNCQIYYTCRNGTAIKYSCSMGYAFHQRFKLCLPESMVKSCGKVYCPPTVLVGIVPDPKNCTRYYRCIYNVPIHYQCTPGSVFDEETGRCKRFGNNNPPECLVNKVNVTTTVRPIISTTLNSTEVPEISTTLSSTEIPTVPTTLESTQVPEIPTLNSTEVPTVPTTLNSTEVPEISTTVSSVVTESTPEVSTPEVSPEDLSTPLPVDTESEASKE